MQREGHRETLLAHTCPLSVSHSLSVPPPSLTARHNLHAGVDGGAVVEPTIDLCQVLGSLVDGNGRVAVPG